MDGVTDLSSVQHSEHARAALRRIDPTKWAPERLQWLWEQTLKEDYATDDLGAATPELFISNLFLPNTEHWEFGDDAYIALLNILREINADVHFAVWGDMAISVVMECHAFLAERMFETYKVNRLTAYIPAFNKKMIRFATILGYRYEGEIREIFLKNKTYHNLFVYGLLKKDYIRRKAGLCLQPQL